MPVKQKKNSGFSLVELAFAMMIVGLMMSASVEAYRAFNKVKPITMTRQNFETVQKALEKFLANNGRLPCPAQPELDTDADKGGKESCTSVFTYASTPPVGNSNGSAAIPLCNNGADYEGGSGLCYVPGRDADLNSATSTDILIGAVPYATVGVDVKNIVDGWGDNIKYAVTKTLTSLDTYDSEGGSIYIAHPASDTTYRTGPPAAPSSTNALAPYPMGSAQVVLLSYGQNRVGKYVYGGATGKNLILTNSLTCNNGTTSTSFGLDFENCNNDMYFFSDEKYSTSKSNSMQHYYDDIVHSVNSISPFSDGYWSYTGQVVSPGVPASTRNAVLSGRVGINTKTPKEMLHVEGNIRANKIYAENFCLYSAAGVLGASACFSPKIIGGEGISCNGTSMIGIQGGKPVCIAIKKTTVGLVPIPASCDPGKAMKGMAADGTIICN